MNRSAVDSIQPLPLSREEFASTLREMQEEQRRFIDAACGIHATATPRWMFHRDGRIEQLDDGLTAAGREAMRQMEAAMREIMRPYLERIERGYVDDDNRSKV